MSCLNFRPLSASEPQQESRELLLQERLLPAIVQSWTEHSVQVKCPFPDCGKTHNHSYTLPHCLQRNIRRSHCSSSSSWSYRMVFPFEADPLVQDLGYQLDVQAMRWRTVGDDIDSATEDADDTGISTLTAKLAIRLQLDEHDHTRQDTTEDPLIKELKSGHGWTAKELIASGASIRSRDTDTGHTVLQVARHTLSWLQKQEHVFAACDDPDYATIRVELRRLNRVTFREIINLCATHENVDRQAKLTARRNARTRTRSQLHLHKSGTGTKAQVSLMESKFTTRIASATKTLAVLDRGAAFEHVRAVSGWTSGIHGPFDGCLDREYWFQKVFDLCKIIGHTLSINRAYDQGHGSGSYFACHAEKQVIAFFLWHHTTIFLDAEVDEEVDKLRKSLPKEGMGLGKDIYVTTACCRDCQAFQQKVYRHCGILFKIHDRVGLT